MTMLGNAFYREGSIVLAFSTLMAVLFCDKAIHIDETYFLAIARHILADPLHPLSFNFNWYGSSVPFSDINVYPPFLPYLLALYLKLSGGREVVMRLLSLPFDLAAAAGLYCLAARFLKKPLWPTLIVLSSPAYLINMHHLMGEKWIGAFGFAGVYFLVRSLDESRRGFYWLSAALLAAACATKYTSVFLAAACFAYGLHRGVALRHALAHAALALSPALVFLFPNSPAAPEGTSAAPVLAVILGAWHEWPHRLRSVLAFAGGCAGALIFWPALGFKSRRDFLYGTGMALTLSLLLFAPRFDLHSMPSSDRVLGILFSTAALTGAILFMKSESRMIAGWELWLCWLLSVSFFQLFVYWSVVTRFILFAVPPAVFYFSALLEARRPALANNRLYVTSFAAMLVLSLHLALVDKAYADAQRYMTELVAKEYIAKGRRVWFTGHWGLQYYMEAAGATAMDNRKTLEHVIKFGDIIVMPRVNTYILRPTGPGVSSLGSFSIESNIPLRLIGDISRRSGFFTSNFGALPYIFASHPLDVFTIFERR